MGRQQRNSIRRGSRDKRAAYLKFAKFLRGLGWFLGTCALLMCVYMILAKASRPFLLSYAESKEISDVKSERDVAIADNKSLKAEKKYLLTNEGKEAEARKLGWVKNGEVAIVVEQPDRTPSPSPEPERLTQPKSKWQILEEKAIGKLLFHVTPGKKSDPVNAD